MIEITWVEILLAVWFLGTLAFSIGFCVFRYNAPGRRSAAFAGTAVGGRLPRLPASWIPAFPVASLPKPSGRKSMTLRRYLLLGTAWISLASLFYSHPAQAIPSFARQTSMACSSCHTSSFGPNLTPFGRKFKLDGYTLGGSGDGPLTKGIPPLSGMLMGSFTHTDQAQPRQDTTGPSSPAFNSNNNLALDQASVFYGGKVYGPIGAFAQFTYDGVGNSVAVDNVDLRYARTDSLWGHSLSYGVTLNNSPTVQDLWNTTPAWGFPFASSPIAPAPGASPLIAEGVAQQVGGGSLYAMLDNLLYLEAGAYGNFGVSAQKNMGVWSPDNAQISGGAPYWRVALQHEWDGQYIEAGTFGMQANLYPNRDTTNFGTNEFTDLGADLTYQYLGDMEHIFEFRGSYIRENQQLNASRAAGLSSQSGVMLNTLNVNGSYTFQQTYTANFGFFNTTGTPNALGYPDYTAARPNSQWFVSELSYVPFGKADSIGGTWLNLRLALQYVAYTKFDGSTKNTGDNNTLFVSGWLAF